MTTELSENNKENNKDAAAKPDPETLNTTDPQEHMEGPISSLVKKAGNDSEGEEPEEDEEESSK